MSEKFIYEQREDHFRDFDIFTAEDHIQVARVHTMHYAKLFANSANAHTALVDALEWLDKTMDGDSSIWCAIREHVGSSEWAENMHKALALAGGKGEK
jgi:hypothetical protein